jgi:dimethylaniline monooxygenase (N-oxide forming)
MKTTVINTSKEMTAYSTFPPPPQFAPFMHNKCGGKIKWFLHIFYYLDMLDYLRLFADSFNFGAFLRLRHSVVDIRRAPSYEDDGKWILKYRKPWE